MFRRGCDSISHPRSYFKHLFPFTHTVYAFLLLITLIIKILLYSIDDKEGKDSSFPSLTLCFFYFILVTSGFHVEVA